MNITGTGFFLILLGLFGFFFKRQFLYAITIFFIPFSATAVINIGSGDTGSAIQPFMFLGLLWMVSFFVNSLRRPALALNRRELRAIVLLLGFLISALISLYVPYQINGHETANRTGRINDFEPILFTSKNITQYLYLVYGVCFSIAIYFYNRIEGKIYQTVKIYAWAVLFVMLWGGVELFCYYSGITYPAFIFNNSISSSAGGYGALMEEGGLKRISSVAVEPSILNQSVIIFLPFLIFSVIYKHPLFGKRADLAFIVILVLFVFRTTSASGLLSLVFVVCTTMYSYIKIISNKRRILLMIAGLVIIPIFISVIYLTFKSFIDETLFNKGETYSSIERINSINEAWSNFKHHPIFGIGWGSVTSFDLFVKILSSTGLVGFIFFLAFVVVTLLNLIRTNHNSLIKNSLIISFSALLFSNIISGFSFVFGFFWLITGLALIYRTTLNTQSR